MSDKDMLLKCKNDPVFFAERVLGVTLWDKQKAILWSIRDNPNTIVVSCNAGGKSFISAVAVLWWLFTNPGSLVLTTAPTWRQVISVLWAEVGRLYNNARIPLGGELTNAGIKVDDKWFALGLPSSEEVRFQGYHAENILIIFDEAAGIEPHIFTAASGNLTSQNSRWLLIGNPTSPSGMFFEYSKNPNWNKIHISAFDSPALQDPDKWPFLVNRKWINERLTEWGEASPMYQARVLGQFPVEGEDTLIPMTSVLAAVKRWELPQKDVLVSDHVYLGVDIGRYGRDSSVVVTYRPNKVMNIRKHTGRDTVATTHLVSQEAMSAGSRLVQITTDDTAVGAGVTDNLRAQGYPVVGINFANKASNFRHFRRVRDEMWWNLRQHFISGEIAIPPDEKLISQLTSVKYSVDPNSKQTVVENKDDMLKRGLKSPDEGDALALCLWGAKRIKTPRVLGLAGYESPRRYEDRKLY